MKKKRSHKKKQTHKKPFCYNNQQKFKKIKKNEMNERNVKWMKKQKLVKQIIIFKRVTNIFSFKEIKHKKKQKNSTENRKYQK